MVTPAQVLAQGQSFRPAAAARCGPAASRGALGAGSSILAAGRSRRGPPSFNPLARLALPAASASLAGLMLAPGRPRDDACDVVGLGQAMLDCCVSCSPEAVRGCGVQVGERRVIDAEGRARVHRSLEGQDLEVQAGGSLANTLQALGQLGKVSAAQGGPGLRVGMVSIHGSDPEGAFHAAQLERAGVAVRSAPCPDSSTGTVFVLTTPDADRTFLAYLGARQHLAFTPAVERTLSNARLVVIEGYLWEMPGAAEKIRRAAELAHAGGALVAMTAGDAGVVGRHRDEMWAAITGAGGGVDIFFANRGEAACLLREDELSAREAALRLGSHCSVAAITDGAHGSYLSALGCLEAVPPHWTPTAPADTNGAGDAYMAGLLLGYLWHWDVRSIGAAGSRVASMVISRRGGALREDEARALLPQILPPKQHQRGPSLGEVLSPQGASPRSKVAQAC